MPTIAATKEPAEAPLMSRERERKRKRERRRERGVVIDRRGKEDLETSDA